MSIKIRPLGERVLVERLDDEQISPGGIVIPETAKEKPMRGKILAVGKGKRLDNGEVRALDLHVGETILFGKYAGTEVKIQNHTYLILREEDILGVFDH